MKPFRPDFWADGIPVLQQHFGITLDELEEFTPDDLNALVFATEDHLHELSYDTREKVRLLIADIRSTLRATEE